MKINWGTGIAALYIGFVAMILLLVTMSIGQKIDLVTEHYYEEELEFQGKIDKINRSANLSEPVKWQVNEQGITIFYPKSLEAQNLSGEVRLYCPSDNRNDQKFPVLVTGHEQFIPASSIPNGTYRLQVDWKNNDQTYWNEDVIVINHAN
jgi:hypothetical protein